MKKTLFALSLILTLASCSKYQYSFKMIKPVESSDLVFENDTVKVKIIPSGRAFNMAIQNKLNVPLKVIWDDVSLVFLNNTNKVYHKETLAKDRHIMMPNTNIPPLSRLTEYVMPASYTELKCGKYTGCVYEVRPFIPMNAVNQGRNQTMADRYNGSTISILMPIRINEVNSFYNFVFAVKAEKIEKKK